MLLRVAAALPLALVLGAAGAEIRSLVPAARDAAEALEALASCAEARAERAAAVADGLQEETDPQGGTLISVPIPPGAWVASVSPGPPDGCGSPATTTVRFTDGTALRLAGRGTLVGAEGGRALFRTW